MTSDHARRARTSETVERCSNCRRERT